MSSSSSSPSSPSSSLCATVVEGVPNAQSVYCTTARVSWWSCACCLGCCHFRANRKQRYMVCPSARGKYSAVRNEQQPSIMMCWEKKQQFHYRLFLCPPSTSHQSFTHLWCTSFRTHWHHHCPRLSWTYSATREHEEMHFVPHRDDKEQLNTGNLKFKERSLICYAEALRLLCKSGYFFSTQMQILIQCRLVILVSMWISPWLAHYIPLLGLFSHLYPPCKARWWNINDKMTITAF